MRHALTVAALRQSVEILDYSVERHVNFEAEIHYPEDEGILQVEHI